MQTLDGRHYSKGNGLNSDAVMARVGEGDQPAHPHGLALARTLLAAGADPNDGQGLYNRQFGSDDTHLRLLLDHGLGRGDGGPWRARLGQSVDSPRELVRGQLRPVGQPVRITLMPPICQPPTSAFTGPDQLEPQRFPLPNGSS